MLKSIQNILYGLFYKLILQINKRLEPLWINLNLRSYQGLASLATALLLKCASKVNFLKEFYEEIKK